MLQDILAGILTLAYRPSREGRIPAKGPEGEWLDVALRYATPGGGVRRRRAAGLPGSRIMNRRLTWRRRPD